MSLIIAFDGLGVDPQAVDAIHSEAQDNGYCTVNVYLKSGAILPVYRDQGPDDADEIVSGMTNDFREAAERQTEGAWR